MNTILRFNGRFLLPLIAGVSGALLASGTHSPAHASQTSSRPPEVTLNANSGMQRGQLRGHCWPGRGGLVQCGDNFLPSGEFASDSYLPVLAGKAVTFKIYLNEKPTKLVLHAFRVPSGTQMGGPFHLPSVASPTWRVSLRPGRYVLTLGATWKYVDGPPGTKYKDAGWEFGIEVLGARTLPKSGFSDGLRPLGLMAISVALAGACFLRRRRSTGLKPTMRTLG